jgi:ribonuclease HI
MSHWDTKQRKCASWPNVVDYEFSKCHLCARFLAACPPKSFGGDSYRDKGRCYHYFQVVFTDGACSNNGRDNAKAGLGITIGTKEEFCWSIAVDDAVDPGAARTSQRAELLAAIEGLKKLEERHETHYTPATQEYRDIYIVVTDSEYVVEGITEWVPAWRVSPSLWSYYTLSNE